MPEFQGSIKVDNEANVQHTGIHRFDGGSKFVIVDPTDPSKSVIFNNTHNIVVTPENGNIDGAGLATISTDYGVLRLYSDGTNYFTW